MRPRSMAGDGRLDAETKVARARTTVTLEPETIAIDRETRHGARAPRPTDRRGRLVPPSGGRRLPHAHRRGHDLRGPAAAVHRRRRAHPLAPAPRPALPPEARLPAVRERPAAVDRRRELQHRVPRAPQRTAGARHRAAADRLAARIVSQQLDRSKPLWECWFVEGLEDGRFALIFKTHHALVDGVSGVDLATVLFDLAPDAPAAAGGAVAAAARADGAELLAAGAAGAAQDRAQRRRANGRRGHEPGRRGRRRCATSPRASAR